MTNKLLEYIITDYKTNCTLIVHFQKKSTIIFMWIVYALFNTFLCGTIDIIEKKNSKEQPYHFIAFGLLIFNLISMISGLIYNPLYLINFNFMTALKVLPYCVFLSLGHFCSVKAFQKGNISIVSPIMRSKIIFVLFLSFLLLNERFKLVIYGLILIVIILNIFLVNQNQNQNHQNSKISILYACGFVFFNGLATFLNKIFVMDLADPFLVSFYTGLIGVLFLLIILATFNKTEYLNITKFKKIKMVFVMEFIEVVAMYLYRYALIEGPLTIVSAISSCSIVFALIFSKIVFKEKISFVRWLLVIGILICVVLLTLFGS